MRFFCAFFGKYCLPPKETLNDFCIFQRKIFDSYVFPASAEQTAGKPKKVKSAGKALKTKAESVYAKQN